MRAAYTVYYIHITGVAAGEADDCGGEHRTGSAPVARAPQRGSESRAPAALVHSLRCSLAARAVRAARGHPLLPDSSRRRQLFERRHYAECECLILLLFRLERRRERRVSAAAAARAEPTGGRAAPPVLVVHNAGQHVAADAVGGRELRVPRLVAHSLPAVAQRALVPAALHSARRRVVRED